MKANALPSLVRFSVERTRHLLSRCATSDDSLTVEVAGEDMRLAALDPKSDALVRISALVALGAPDGLWQSAITRAFGAGACDEDIVATLISVATITGQVRVTSAAPAIARGIGYEIDGAFQS